MTPVAEAKERYRPQNIKLIFIAEAPPCATDRFFYFEDVQKGDSLFLHIIRAVFPDLEQWETKQIRARKEELLYRFMEEGYFLDHSVPESIPKGTKPKDKVAIIKNEQAGLIKRLEKYKAHAKLVLISANVFSLNYELLNNAGFDILNDFKIPYPGSGQQGKFKDGIAQIDVY